MSFKIYSTIEKQTQQAVEDIITKIGEDSPGIIMIFPTVAHDIDLIRKLFVSRFPESRIAGGSTCQTVLTHEGIAFGEGYSIGVVCYSSPSFECGVGFSDHPNGVYAGELAAEDALSDIGREGELPDFIWMFCCPDQEELYIEGIQNYFGAQIPIVGGTAADNDLSGKWAIFNKEQVSHSGLVVVAIYSSNIITSFLSGYEATDKFGKVTEVYERHISKIDDKPAADVYNEWTGGLITGALADEAPEANILKQTSLSPLGREIAKVAGLPYYLLSHPERVSKDRSLAMFTDFEVGDEVYLMKGSVDSLKVRASTIIKSLMLRENVRAEKVEGALIVYCAGCMLALHEKEELDLVSKNISTVLPDVPLMGIFTFGEQGFFPNNENRHGNLMISATLFVK